MYNKLVFLTLQELLAMQCYIVYDVAVKRIIGGIAQIYIQKLPWPLPCCVASFIS